MIKKPFLLVLLLFFIFTFSASALAATEPDIVPISAPVDSSMDKDLQAVLLLVKKQLPISDDYIDFYGSAYTNVLATHWDLSWASDDYSLSIIAGEDGKIFSYFLYNHYRENNYSSRFFPIFPNHNFGEIDKAAQDFLKKVLRKGETVEFNEDIGYALSPYDNNSLFGNLYFNGQKTTISISMELSQDLQVLHFFRDDEYSSNIRDIVKMPTGSQLYAKTKAEMALQGKVELQLQYVCEDSNWDQGKAVLQYRPLFTGDWVVDATSGDLLDANNLYTDFYGKYGNTATAPAAGEYIADEGVSRLTQAELDGISRLEGALDVKNLDNVVRSIKALNINNAYILSDVSYYYGEQDEPLCSLSYSAKATAALMGLKAAQFKIDSYDSFIYKTVIVNAKTGKIDSLMTYYPYWDGEEATGKTDEELTKTATDFLKEYNEHFDEVALIDEAPVSLYKDKLEHSFHYSRIVNDIFFRQNYIYISLNANTGFIDDYSSYWQDDIDFADPRGIIDADMAMNTYLTAAPAELEYINKPIDEKYPEFCLYAEAGFYYVYDYYLVYKLNTMDIYGVDAKTGEVLTYAAVVNIPNYNDISTHYAREKIERLAEYGVGFASDSFLPSKQLTQIDLIELLVSANGWGRYYIMDEENLYEQAYQMGILKPTDKNPEKRITRSEMVKTVIAISDYAQAAALQGIYNCGFADDASIAKSDYGYIAIAKGIGMVQGDQNNQFNPSLYITRAEAAVMLYNFLDR